MKQSLSPGLVAGIIAVVVIIAGFFLWRSVNPGRHDGQQPPGMPPSVAAEFNKRMSKAGLASGSTSPAPNSSNPGGPPAASSTAPATH